MLRRLSVSNYVLIDSLEIDFPEGLIIITGQTGAGKSILLGALSLLMGGRADASVISEGARNCVVEAEFDMAEDDVIREILEENDVEWDGGHLLVRRVVNDTGRSRSFVNDSPVNVQLLGRISSKLIDIHSQHQNLALSDKAYQQSVLDLYAGNAGKLEECRKAFAELQKLRHEAEEVTSRLRDLASEREYNEAQFRQLEAASLKEGELEELELEQQQLANAEEIKEMLCGIEELSSPSNDDIASVDSLLRSAAQQLARVSRFIPRAGALSERMESARIELADILDDVSSINSKVNVSSERLQFVEDRMNVLYSLLKKHSCHDISELISVRDKFGDALFDSESLELRSRELSAAVAGAEARLDTIASELHSARVGAVRDFSSAIMDSLAFLEMERAVFDIRISPAEMSPSGADAVSFLFSASGGSPAELSKCASGGELSRIMLSLKALMAGYQEMPTMIFDEIDTGVSGSAADRMGSMICGMGHDMQVFAITHLPQVAAKGDAHYMVSKSSSDSGRTVSSIKKLDSQERVMEVARMLSGSVITEAAVANAESLLSAE